MESAIIDRLYEIYTTENDLLAQDVMMSTYLMPESKGGGEVLINHVKDYINSNMNNLPNYFLSQEAETDKDYLVRNISTAMDYLADVMDYYRIEVRQKAIRESGLDDDNSSIEDTDDYFDDYVDEEDCVSAYEPDVDDDAFFEYPDDDFEETMPQELFFMSKDAMKSAFEKYQDKVSNLSPETFNQVLDFIEYIKSNRLISRIFVDNDICRLSLDSVVSALVDADANIMRTFFVDELGERVERDFQYKFADYFQYMKAGCDNIKDLEFQEYRATFNSRRGFNVDLDKLVFARNLLEFVRTGVLPSPGGFIDFSVDPYTKYQVEDNFKQLYSRGFDNKRFVDMQSNIIFDMDNTMLYPGKFEQIKSVRKGKELSIGCLMTSDTVVGNAVYDGIYYLIHIHIDDVTNDKSNYELQLNILPHGEFENRVQLVRFDNWAEEQSHKNIGNKLRTTTHIHLYNHFDLLRGKKNGGYDIAFNLEEDSTDFDVALKVFLEFISSDNELYKELLKKISRTVTYAQQKAAESEMI